MSNLNDSIEETIKPSLKYNQDGLITVITQDWKSGEVLMLAWANGDALERTLKTGQAHYWSRSRGELWHKGATSGAFQMVREIRVDCDQDAVLFLVEQTGGGACHTGRPSCFYRKFELGGESEEKKLTFLTPEEKVLS